MESQADDSDGGNSMTPSEQSEGDDRSEHDSDYETDEGKEAANDIREKNLNIMWTGYAKRVPVILFNVTSILYKNTNFKTVGDRYHMTFKFVGPDCKIMRNIMLAHGFHEVHPSCPDFNLMWTSTHLKPFTLRSLTEFQKINHFPRSSELTRKDRLYKNIQRMQQIKGIKHFDFVPQTFVMPNEYQEFCSQFLKDRGPWIVKPVASSRGRGVFLVNHPDQVPFDENVIVSHYLHNPLVIDGFKFDIRLYVAVTSYDPLVIYLYEEGLTRFATVKYEKSTKHLRNQCMHLTNYSVNKKSTDYVKNDDPEVEDYGNKWSMGAMLRYLRSIGKDTPALMMRIEDVVIKTLLSVELSIATACKMFMPFRGNCFELYGFDILVDDTLKPWVLEVNLSPSLACDSPLDLKIKGNMLCDLFSLAGIICHDPMVRSLQQQSRRNQELVRLTRAKTALSRTGISRPVGIYPKFGPFAGVKKARPQSASGSTKTGYSTQGMKTLMTGLNSEEIKIVRRVKEEEQRKGGWIRIFPGPDTWDVHGPFLQFSTTHNLMLHQRLYPERHKQVGLKTMAACSFSAAVRSKNGYLQVMGTGQRLETNKAVESYILATVRARQYERKLGPRLKRKRRSSKQKDACGQLVQGMADDLEDGENMSEEEYEQVDSRGRQQWDMGEDRQSSGTMSRASTSTEPTKRSLGSSASQHSESSSQQSRLVKEKSGKEKRIVEVKVETSHSHYPFPSAKLSTTDMAKFNVLEAMNEGYMLSKVQARSAFTMYLQRVKERLVTEGDPQLPEDVEALNEQMDLVLLFLKRAASNLQHMFKVVVPSHRLPLVDRCYIMAKQLTDFIHIYNRETEQLKQQLKHGERSFKSASWVNEAKFTDFINKASENDLEQVLTTYTRLNKNSSIFLGSSSPSPSPPFCGPGRLPPQAQHYEMIQPQQWREASGEVDHCQASVGYPTILKDGSMDSDGIQSMDSMSRPCSASSSTSAAGLSGPRPLSSGRLGRPQSATSLKQDLKVISRPGSARPTPFSTSDPTVETYNAQAIRKALQHLTKKQQARMYGTGNNIITLQNTDSQTTPASKTASREEQLHHSGSLLPLNKQTTDYSTSHPGTLLQRVSSGLESSSSQYPVHKVGDSTSVTTPNLLASSLSGSSSNKIYGTGHKFTVSQSLHQSDQHPAKKDQEGYCVSYVFPQPDNRLQGGDQAGLSELVSLHPAAQQELQKTAPGSVRKDKVAIRGKPPLPAKEDLGSAGAVAGGGKIICQNLMDLYGEHLTNIVFGKHKVSSQDGHLRQSRRPHSTKSQSDLIAADSVSMNSQRSQTSQQSAEHKSQTLMEASKAKHHAMVAQAHAAQRGSTLSMLGSSSQSLRDPVPSKQTLAMKDMEGSIARGVTIFSPRPPVQLPMFSTRSIQQSTGPHRVMGLSYVEKCSLSQDFHNSLKCDLQPQQLRKTEANAGQ